MLFRTRYNVLFRQFRLVTAQAGSIPAAIRLIFENCYRTRNYYTHYDEAIKKKGRVLTSGELIIYNKALLHVLEYYLLLELGFKDELYISKKLNDRWGCASQDLSIMKRSKEMFNSNQ